MPHNKAVYSNIIRRPQPVPPHLDNDGILWIVHPTFVKSDRLRQSGVGQASDNIRQATVTTARLAADKLYEST